jgi:hypothetical protein
MKTNLYIFYKFKTLKNIIIKNQINKILFLRNWLLIIKKKNKIIYDLNFKKKKILMVSILKIFRFVLT